MKKFVSIFKEVCSNDRRITSIIVLLVSALFLCAGAYFLYDDAYEILYLPAVLLGVFLLIFRLDTILYFIALSTPLALDVYITPESRLSLPSEPMLIAFTLCFLASICSSGKYDSKILRHPVSIAILISIVWMLITSATSTLPAVSFKYVASRVWFVVPCFYGLAVLFKRIKNFKWFYWLYCFSFLIIILISSYKFAEGGFEFWYSHKAMRPFYNDHTVYGAMIAFFLPICFLFIAHKEFYKKKGFRALIIIAFAILLMGFAFSYSRAAWLSIGAAFGMYCVLRMKVKMKWILWGAIIFALSYVYYQNDIIQNLEKNSQDSSGNVSEQLQSVSNISTDASNVERLNRWACAFEMIEERPFLGFGPGTYQFEYGKFQKSYHLSTISTSQGDLGTAHSEYFGPLAEQGILGGIFILLVFLLAFRTGVRVYRLSANKEVRLLGLYLTLSLFTYYVHGLVNNFLDTDKASVPFWGFVAAIVALDVYFEKTGEIEKPKNEEPLAIEA